MDLHQVFDWAIPTTKHVDLLQFYYTWSVFLGFAFYLRFESLKERGGAEMMFML